MNVLEYLSQFEEYARRLKMINHTDAKPRFMVLGAEQLVEPDQKYDLKHLTLCLHHFEGNIQFKRKGYNQLPQRVQFSLIKQADFKDGRKQLTVYNEAYSAGMKILGHLQYLIRNGECYFTLTSATFDKTTKLVEGAVGVLWTLDLLEKYVPDHNPEDWYD